MSYDSKLRHTKEGEEVLDPKPKQPPLGYKRTPTLAEQIAQQVRRMKLELLRDDSITETEDEADDFEVGDDFEPFSPYENDHIPSLKKLKAKAQEINAQIAEHNRRAAIAAHEKAIRKPVSITNPSSGPGRNLGDPAPISTPPSSTEE